jgi:hypothetical protein
MMRGLDLGPRQQRAPMLRRNKLFFSLLPSWCAEAVKSRHPPLSILLQYNAYIQAIRRLGRPHNLRPAAFLPSRGQAPGRRRQVCAPGLDRISYRLVPTRDEGKTLGSRGPTPHIPAARGCAEGEIAVRRGRLNGFPQATVAPHEPPPTHL